MVPDLGVMVLLRQILTFLGLFILKVKDIEGSSALVGVANLVLGLHSINTLILSILLIFHILPTLEITLILLNSIYGIYNVSKNKVEKLRNLPSGVDQRLLPRILFLSTLFFDSREVLVESVTITHVVTRLVIRCIHHDVVNVLVKVADTIAQSLLLVHGQVGWGLIVHLRVQL